MLEIGLERVDLGIVALRRARRLLASALLVLAISFAPLAARAQCLGHLNNYGSPTGAALLADLAVPGYSSYPYDTIAMSFWLHDGSTADTVGHWALSLAGGLGEAEKLALTGISNPTAAQIRAAIRDRDRAAGVTRLVSAFGATDQPIASGADAAAVATALANFVSTYDLDGVIVSFEEGASFDSWGTGEAWLTTLTTTLHALLPPDAILAHGPQAPYFKVGQYPAGGYQAVHANVGHLIDYYAVQFYNQGSTTYETEQTLVTASNGWATGTALNEIIATGIPASQIYVGKGATPADVPAGGYIDPATLSTILANNPSSWGGAAVWRFESDEANGFAYGNAVCPIVQPVPDCSILRWRFDQGAGNSAVDGTVVPESACGLDGQVTGAGAAFTGDAIDLPGGASASGAAYVDLPNGLVSPLSDATFEAWYTPTGVHPWMRVFDFGTTTNGEVPPNAAGTGTDYIFYSPVLSTDVDIHRTEMSTPTGFYRVDSNLPTTLGQGYHLAVTFETDGAAPGVHRITTYRDGMPIAVGTSTSPLSDVDDVNNWLGRSNYGGDGFFEGTIEEFRLYDQALGWSQVLHSYQQGPDVTDVVVPEPGFGLGLLASLAGLLAASRRRRATV